MLGSFRFTLRIKTVKIWYINSVGELATALKNSLLKYTCISSESLQNVPSALCKTPEFVQSAETYIRPIIIYIRGGEGREGILLIIKKSNTSNRQFF